jgi:hypothetical protein
MTKDLRRGELDLLPMLFQSLMDFERIIAHYRLLDAGTVRSWKANRDQLVRAWDGLAQAAALYAATCPELGAERGDD